VGINIRKSEETFMKLKMLKCVAEG